MTIKHTIISPGISCRDATSDSFFFSKLITQPAQREASDAGLADDAMRLMFSCLVNTQHSSESASNSRLFNFWLISNVEIRSDTMT